MFGSLVRLEISDEGSRVPESHRDPCILFLFQGKAEVTVGNHHVAMNPEDYMVINSFEIYSVSLSDEGLLGRLHMNYAELSDYLDLAENDIRCSAYVGSREMRERFRRRLKQIFSYYEGRRGENASRVMALYFELLYDLRMNCMVKKSERIVARRNDDAAVEETIRRFLEEHYLEKIMLKDLARETFFSEAYLSRYIKQHFGKNFLKLLIDIRVSHAAQLLHETDASIIRVAMDSGFADLSAMNKAFMAEYNVSPADYRRIERDKAAKEKDEREEQEEHLDSKIRRFFREEGADYRTEEADVQRLFTDSERFRRLKNFWTRMINAGRAQEILRADVQQQILLLQSEIGIRYVRFWDIWSPEMRIYSGDGQKHYNFSMMDAVIAFLYDHHIYPYIELGMKPIQLNSSFFDALVYEERKSPFSSLEEYVDCIEEMLRHYIWLYGTEYVERWYLELWLDTRTEALTEYLEIFETVYRRLKAEVPGIRIGGAGMNREKEPIFEQLIKTWKNRLYHPDFISVYLYFFDNGFLKNENNESNRPEIWRGGDYIIQFLQKVQRILRENDFGAQELHLSEWNFTAGNRDPVNDSTFKSAFIIKSLLEMEGQVDVAGYWPGLDLVTGYFDTGILIDGSAGVLTRNTIRKPAFYGLQFMSHLDDYVIGQDANMIVTTNRRGSYRMVCHNWREPEDSYYEQFGTGTVVKTDPDSYFVYEEREFRVVIRNVENGSYYIKKRLMDRQHGSVQEEWKRMGLSDTLNVKDIEYLRGICVPQITVDNAEVTSGELTIDFKLESNAILSVHIFRSDRT